MKLHQRLQKIIDKIEDGNRAELCRKIKVIPTTFLGYLDQKGQQKIKFITLTQILEAYPQINRDWLLFGEGEIFGERTKPKEKKSPEQPASAQDGEKQPEPEDAISVRIRTAVKALKEAKASNEMIQEAIMAILKPGTRYEIKPEGGKGGNMAAEPHAEYRSGEGKKQAG